LQHRPQQPGVSSWDLSLVDLVVMIYCTIIPQQVHFYWLSKANSVSITYHNLLFWLRACLVPLEAKKPGNRIWHISSTVSVRYNAHERVVCWFYRRVKYTTHCPYAIDSSKLYFFTNIIICFVQLIPVVNIDEIIRA
jgi:hypothetical protein